MGEMEHGSYNRERLYEQQPQTAEENVDPFTNLYAESCNR